jgi:peptide/nickel transport system substrate-binding protein
MSGPVGVGIVPVLALPVLVALLIGGCGAQAPAGDEVRLRFGLSAEAVTLDPRHATDAVSSRINRLLYAQLVDFDERFTPQPALARWELISERRYRFRLGDTGRRFHDGTRLGARDVKATYDSVLDPATGSAHRGSLSMIRALEVVDEDTVDVVLEHPDPLLPGRLTVGIVPAALIESGHPLGRRPVGSGPFRFQAWPDGGRLAIQRQRDGVVVEFVRVASPTVRVLKLLRSEIDMLQGDLPPELVSWLSRQGGVNIARAAGTTFAYLGFNMDDTVTGDARVRRAIAHALDREAIIRHLLGGAARPASSILGPGHWAADDALAPIAHDPVAARRLLADAGFTGRGPRIVYKTSSDPFRLRLATVIQAQLADVGIDVVLRSFDWGTFYGDIRAGRFQMFSLAWVGVKMPDIFRYTMHSEARPPAGANRGHYSSATVDALIEAAEVAPSLGARAALYRAVQSELHQDLPYVPLWYEDQVFAARRGITAYAVSPDGNFDGLLSVEVDRGAR